MSVPEPADDRAAQAASARLVFRELDKAGRATRTYGLHNAVTQRCFEQLEAGISAHLEIWPVLGVVVERAELRLYDEVVYLSEDSLGESFAFRLYGDGVRELRFEQGLSPHDLHAFLDALWAVGDAEADDDVVTRLWSKNLATVSFVTAEDLLKAPWTEELVPQEHGFFAPPPGSFKSIIEREQAAAAASPRDRLGTGHVGFEVSDEERAALERALAEERATDSKTYVLRMLEAILASESSPELLNRALAVVPGILDALLAAGDWAALLGVLTMLEHAADKNPGFEITQRMLASRVMESLNVPERLSLIETGLNAHPERPPAGLAEVLSRLRPAAVGAVCGVLAKLAAPEHRAVLRSAIALLAADDPEPVLKGLADPRPQYLRDLIAIIVGWNQSKGADALAMLASNEEAEVRRDAVAGIAALRSRGDGAALVVFASDPLPELRAEVLHLLSSGRYTAPWRSFRPHVDLDAVSELGRDEKRALFQALRATAGDEAVPWWQSILLERGRKQRPNHEETALFAVKALALLDTPRAREALAAGEQDGNPAVRKACAAALAANGS